jgi:hypothetical protein
MPGSPGRSPNPRDWRLQPLSVTQRAQADVLRILTQARKDITRSLHNMPEDSARLRRAQLRHVRAIIAKAQARIWRDIGDVVRARRLEAASRMLELGADFDNFLFQRFGRAGLTQGELVDLVRSERAAVASGFDRMMARVLGQSYVPLSTRVYNSNVWINGRLDTRLNSALARGLSAREFAAELGDFINPDTPGGIRYAAMRLARSEINNAAHAVAVNSAQGKPWISGMQWQLSASHPKPDVCDDLAEGGLGGNGIYDVDKVPAKPHPQCFCSIVPLSVSDEQFLINLVSGNYDDYAAQYLDLAA